MSKKGSLFAQRLRDSKNVNITNSNGFPTVFNTTDTTPASLPKPEIILQPTQFQPIANDNQISEPIPNTENTLENSDKKTRDLFQEDKEFSQTAYNKPKPGPKFDVLTEQDIQIISNQNIKAIQQMSESELKKIQNELEGMISKKQLDSIKSKRNYLSGRFDETKASIQNQVTKDELDRLHEAKINEIMKDESTIDPVQQYEEDKTNYKNVNGKVINPAGKKNRIEIKNYINMDDK